MENDSINENITKAYNPVYRIKMTPNRKRICSLEILVLLAKNFNLWFDVI